jgi:hypothetical protein
MLVGFVAKLCTSPVQSKSDPPAAPEQGVVQGRGLVPAGHDQAVGRSAHAHSCASREAQSTSARAGCRVSRIASRRPTVVEVLDAVETSNGNGRGWHGTCNTVPSTAV